MMGLPVRERGLTISSAVWIHERDGQRDRRTQTAKTALIRIASRGKNVFTGHILHFTVIAINYSHMLLSISKKQNSNIYRLLVTKYC